MHISAWTYTEMYMIFVCVHI